MVMIMTMTMMLMVTVMTITVVMVMVMVIIMTVIMALGSKMIKTMIGRSAILNVNLPQIQSWHKKRSFLQRH